MLLVLFSAPQTTFPFYHVLILWHLDKIKIKWIVFFEMFKIKHVHVYSTPSDQLTFQEVCNPMRLLATILDCLTLENYLRSRFLL